MARNAVEVRELNGWLGRLLQVVRGGQTFVLTHRGAPIADLAAALG